MLRITEQDMIEEARGLLEPGEEGASPEYFRALTELVARCFGRPDMDTPGRASEVAAQLMAARKRGST